MPVVAAEVVCGPITLTTTLTVALTTTTAVAAPYRHTVQQLVRICSEFGQPVR